MNKREAKKIVTHLRALGHGETKPRQQVSGLCYELAAKFNTKLDRLSVDVTKYPEYSGNSYYPIKHPTKAPMYAYTYIRNLWDGSTSYGKARLRFCLWVADQIEENYL